MDAEAFDAFYSSSFSNLVGQIYAMCGDFDEAQDCVQEAFVRAWDRRKQLDRDRAPEAWVRTVAWRLAVSRWRRARRTLMPPDRSSEPREPPRPDVRAIVLHHLCDLSVIEVAEETGVPVGAVKARLSRGRTALAVLLADDANEESVMADYDDALERLRELAADGSRRAFGLPGLQVHALGDRRHRHRLVATGAAVSIAVAAFAGGAFAAVSQLADRTEPQPAASPGATAPPGGWLTEIPSSFDLTSALPDLGGDGVLSGPSADLEAFGELEACAEYPTEPSAVERTGLRYDGPEYSQRRGLLLYADAQVAHDVLHMLVEGRRRLPWGDGN